MAFVTCRLIPLGKKLAVRSIGIGNVPRGRDQFAKAILPMEMCRIDNDIQLSAGAFQMCAVYGHDACSEAAIYEGCF